MALYYDPNLRRRAPDSNPEDPTQPNQPQALALQRPGQSSIYGGTGLGDIGQPGNTAGGIGQAGGAANVPQTFARPGQGSIYGGTFAGPTDPGQIRDTSGNQVFPSAQPQAQPQAQATAGRQTIYNPDKAGIFGFETAKLSGDYSNTKYSPAAKVFSQGLGAGIQLNRGNLGDMVNYARSKGFNAQQIGEDKIDFGDGRGPIDVLADQGGGRDLVTFQNTTDNPQWMAQYGGTVQHGGGHNVPPPPGHYAPAQPAAPAYQPPPAAPQAPAAPAPPSWQAQTAQTYTAPNPLQLGTINTPDALTLQQVGSPDQFTDLTAAQLQSDPSYQWRLQQTMNAMQNQAAARGLLHSTNTVQGLGDVAGQMASQEYAAANQRALEQFGTNWQAKLAANQANNAALAQSYGLTNQYQQAAQQMNQQNALAAYQANVQAGLGYGGLNQQAQQIANAWNIGQRQADIEQQLGLGNINLGYTRAANDLSLGQGQLALGNRQADIQRELGLGNLGLGYYSAGNQYNLGLGNQQLGWANYGLNADQQQFGQGYALANLGLSAAGQYGNAAGQYGAHAGDYATQAGNAAAAGQVGGANAWANALGQIPGAGMAAYGIYDYMHQNAPPPGPTALV